MGYCLYKVGCKGPVTYNACSAMRWNEGLSFPIQSGHGCIGCSEDAFWDKGSFYDHLTTIQAAGRTAASKARPTGSASPPSRPPARRSRRTPRSARSSRRAARPATTSCQRSGEVIMATIQTQGFTLDNSGKRIVVDPITRIEGHLRIEVNVDKDNVIRNAVSTGTMWRGLEVILKGRDPRDAWAFVERICGVCTGVHALASVRSVEDALGDQDPEEREHHPQPDALDAVRAGPPGPLLPPARARLGRRRVGAEGRPEEDLRARSRASRRGRTRSPGYFREVQNRLKKFVESGQLGIFANGYWGSPAYKLPPEANLMATTHYLEALDFQKEIVKIQTIFGGKNPHPNWLVGGVPCSINVDGTGAVGAINMAYLNMVGDIMQPHDRVHRPGLHPRPARDRRLLQGLGEVGRRAVRPERDVLRRVPGHRRTTTRTRACCCPPA